MVTAFYSAEGRADRNRNPPGKTYQVRLASLKAAKSFPFPEDCAFAYVPVDGGARVFHSPAFGWEFFEARESRAA